MYPDWAKSRSAPTEPNMNNLGNNFMKFILYLNIDFLSLFACPSLRLQWINLRVIAVSGERRRSSNSQHHIANINKNIKWFKTQCGINWLDMCIDIVAVWMRVHAASAQRFKCGVHIVRKCVLQCTSYMSFCVCAKCSPANNAMQASFFMQEKAHTERGKNYNVDIAAWSDRWCIRNGCVMP